MTDQKNYPLLVLSIIFLLVSFVLLCILGYNFYIQPGSVKINTPVAVIQPKPLPAVEIKTRDSLSQVYTETVNSFKPDSLITTDSLQLIDSLQTTLPKDERLSDYYKLKNEISSLLKDSISANSLELARTKIRELQLKVEELKIRNFDVEKENKRLRALLEQFAFNTNNRNGSDRIAEPAERSVTENRGGPNSTSSTFSASELRLALVNENDDEVSSAEETEKLSGSLVVRNTLNQGIGELMLVVIQPDGKVLRNAWESGSFDTDKGKRIYSRKLRFDYTKGESRRLNFSVPADSIQKGTYTLNVYSNGKIIGRTVKVVS